MINVSQLFPLLLQLFLRNIVPVCIMTGVLAFIAYLVGDALKAAYVKRASRGIAVSRDLETAGRCCHIAGIAVMLLSFLVLCLSGAYEPFFDFLRSL
ncbi:MAG: hypothetical protein NC399_11335 [Muribaculum sp.]|nr:hypothetical protein [Muribaculum sp.]